MEPEKLSKVANSKEPTFDLSASIEQVNSLSERARALRAEALTILDGGVLALLEHKLGPIEVAGRVKLDLMVLPDIDLYGRLEPAEAPRLLGLVPKLAAQLERQGYALARVAVHDEHVLPDPKFPDTPGLYGGFSFSNRKSGCLWKLDLWGWAGAWFEQRHTHHLDLYQQLKRADRDLILQLKEAEGYGSVFVSVDVYEFALAGEGATLEDFERFLRERTPSMGS